MRCGRRFQPHRRASVAERTRPGGGGIIASGGRTRYERDAEAASGPHRDSGPCPEAGPGLRLAVAGRVRWGDRTAGRWRREGAAVHRSPCASRPIPNPRGGTEGRRVRLGKSTLATCVGACQSARPRSPGAVETDLQRIDMRHALNRIAARSRRRGHHGTVPPEPDPAARDAWLGRPRYAGARRRCARRFAAAVRPRRREGSPPARSSGAR